MHANIQSALMGVPAALRCTVVTVAALLIAAIASCNLASTPSQETIAGDWEVPTGSFPPVNLQLTSAGSELRARLRLSGVERHGRAELTGTTLRITFDDGGALDGRFTSSTELILYFRSSGRTYTLQKRPISPAR
jgi:hypothetical protein